MKSKVFKRLLSISLCLIMVFGTLSIGGVIDFKAFAASGSCGTNVTWELNSDTGELLISGTGAMNDYTTSSTAPWYYNYKGKITKVTIEDSVTSIGQYAFYKCTGLTSITIGNSVTSIGFEAFSGCTGLTSVTIGNSVTSIGSQAFYGCTGLTSITIGNSVTSISERAFYGCTGLTSITIPDSVTRIGYEAFYECTNLKIVYYTGTPTEWSKFSISSDNSYLTSATRIYECNSENPYYNKGTCGENISWILLSTGELVISGTGAMNNYMTATRTPWYSYRKKITKVTIEDGVTTVGSCAFYKCTGLRSVTIGNNVTTIGNEAFSGCTNLAEITIPDSVTCFNYTAFEDTAYYNDELNWKDGVLYITNHLVKAKETLSGDYVINPGTKSIAESAFKDCVKLAGITIPYSVEIVGDSSFEGCVCLVDLIIGNGVKTIGNNSFNGCKSLDNVTIPNSVTTIGDFAFYNTKLTSAKIPSTVTKICKGSFGCKSYSESDDSISYNSYFKVYCEKGSEAHLYAVTNDLTYVFVDDASTPVDAHTHSYTSEITKAATCTITGIETYTCLICGYSYTETKEVLGHSFTTYIYNNDATTTKDGTETATCDRCSETDTRTKSGSKLQPAHTHSFTKSTTAPTCIEQGYTTYACTCGFSYKDDYQSALGHNFVNYSYNNDATTTKDGTETATCERCSVTDTRTKSGSKLQPTHTHSFTKSTTAPTCIEEGYTTYTCSCGYSYKTIFLPATGHADTNNDGYCDNCKIPLRFDPSSNAKINIASDRTVDYRTNVTIKATASGVKPDYTLALYIDNDCKVLNNGNDGVTDVTYYVVEVKSDVKYTVKLFDGYGNVISEEGTIYCNSGFFKKLVAFFKGLFGSLPNVTVQP